MSLLYDYIERQKTPEDKAFDRWCSDKWALQKRINSLRDALWAQLAELDEWSNRIENEVFDAEDKRRIASRRTL